VQELEAFFRLPSFKISIVVCRARQADSKVGRRKPERKNTEKQSKGWNKIERKNIAGEKCRN